MRFTILFGLLIIAKAIGANEEKNIIHDDAFFYSCTLAALLVWDAFDAITKTRKW